MQKRIRIFPVILFYLFLLEIILCVSTAVSQEVTARVFDWPPSSWQENNTWVGIDVEYYQALCEEAHLPFILVDMPWSRALYEMKAGRLNLMAELSKTEERSEYMHFLGPVMTEEMVLVVHKEHQDLKINSLDEMVMHARRVGLTIGIEQDAFYGVEFNHRLENDESFRSNFSFSSVTLAEMIAKKRLFGFIDQKHVVVHKLKSNPIFADFVIHPFTIREAPVYIGLSKKTSLDIVKKLQQATTILTENGTFAAIEAKWKGE